MNAPMSARRHHDKLIANALAQADAFWLGRDNAGRPSSPSPAPAGGTHHAPNAGRISFGALIALYEHKVFTGACCGTSILFDQMGVELGKQLATVAFRGCAARRRLDHFWRRTLAHLATLRNRS